MLIKTTTTSLALKNQSNTLASYSYQIAEILNQPLRLLTNQIIGRLLTVLTPGKFGNYSSKPLEVIRRIFLACCSLPMAAVTLVSSPLSALSNFIGDVCLGSQPYLKLRGNYQGPPKETFATWNMASLVQPRTLVDGVEDSSARLKFIADQLRNFHFVCGQEVDGAAARFFAKELKNDFKEFLSYLGKSNAPLLPSGLFFASKEDILNVYVLPFKGKSIQKSIYRVLAVAELQNFYVAMTHLDSGEIKKLAKTHRMEIEQAINFLQTLPKPVILCGDFNELRYGDTSIAYQALTNHFVDCIKEQSPEKVVTCTDTYKLDRFGEKTLPKKMSIDYITYNKDQDKLKIEFLEAQFHWGVSDHYLVSGKIIFKT